LIPRGKRDKDEFYLPEKPLVEQEFANGP